MLHILKTKKDYQHLWNEQLRYEQTGWTSDQKNFPQIGKKNIERAYRDPATIDDKTWVFIFQKAPIVLWYYLHIKKYTPPHSILDDMVQKRRFQDFDSVVIYLASLTTLKTQHLLALHRPDIDFTTWVPPEHIASFSYALAMRYQRLPNDYFLAYESPNNMAYLLAHHNTLLQNYDASLSDTYFASLNTQQHYEALKRYATWPSHTKKAYQNFILKEEQTLLPPKVMSVMINVIMTLKTYKSNYLYQLMVGLPPTEYASLSHFLLKKHNAFSKFMDYHAHNDVFMDIIKKMAPLILSNVDTLDMNNVLHTKLMTCLGFDIDYWKNITALSPVSGKTLFHEYTEGELTLL